MIPFWTSIREDLDAHGSTGWIAVVVGSSGFHVAMLYRCSSLARTRGGWLGRLIAAILFWFLRHAYGCSIAPTATIGGGLILPHPQGIVIGPGVSVGPRAWIFQNATIGGSPGRAGLPTIGRDARIFPGAVIAGPIRVGDNVVIGANAVVLEDVPDQMLVRSPTAEMGQIPEGFRVVEKSDQFPGESVLVHPRKKDNKDVDRG